MFDRGTGDYQLLVKGEQWLRSAPTYFTIKGKRYSSAPGGGLKISFHQRRIGTGYVGTLECNSIHYTPEGVTSVDIRIIFKTYAFWTDIVLFGQVSSKTCLQSLHLLWIKIEYIERHTKVIILLRRSPCLLGLMQSSLQCSNFSDHSFHKSTNTYYFSHSFSLHTSMCIFKQSFNVREISDYIGSLSSECPRPPLP